MNWFPTILDDYEYPCILTPVEEEFVAGLRQAATTWHVEPAHTWVWRYWDEPPLLMVLDLEDPHDGRSLGHYGIHLDNGRARGDDLHNQLWDLPEQPTDLALDTIGSTAELVAACAAWFEWILRRPVVRYEWLHNGAVYARRWLFADTGRVLASGLAHPIAPPDRCIHVRGDRDRAALPAGE